MIKTIAIPALLDNYIWLLDHIDLKQCIVVDPGDAVPVLRYLDTHPTQLSAILITHKHADHIDGVVELQKHFPHVALYGPTLKQFPQSINVLQDGDPFVLWSGKLSGTIYSIPGHTLEHIAYYIPDLNGAPAVFTGDTLFSGGCGRLFEGTFEQLYTSLRKLKQLPATTQLYCGHEYTMANLMFAQWLEPDNDVVQSTLKQAESRRFHCEPTLPSHLELEWSINPFLRCDDKAFIKKMEKRFQVSSFTPLTLLRHLRGLKDRWRVAANSL